MTEPDRSTVTSRVEAGVSVLVFPTVDLAARIAVDRICALVANKPDAVIGVATGSSPTPVYEALARRVRLDLVDFSDVTAFALDEYVGLEPSHPESYHAVVDGQVTLPLGMSRAKVHVPDGLARDLEEAGRAYDGAIRASGGIDLQILGIGHNGHIGFNEPGSRHDSGTRPVALAERTRAANARFFGGQTENVPEFALTQGIGTILNARSVVLIASGAQKAEAVARALEGPVDDTSPASALRSHGDVIVLLDDDAAGHLRGRTSSDR